MRFRHENLVELSICWCFMVRFSKLLESEQCQGRFSVIDRFRVRLC